MNLMYLQEFLVLAESGSYSKAAERLYMNQSTLSKHIKALEAELGVSLFERSTRQVRITAYGEHLLPYARQIEALSFQYETELLQRTQKLLTIGTIPTMAEYDLVDLIMRFKERQSAVKIKIVEADSLELKQGLLNRRYDLAFLRDGNPPFSTAAEADEQLFKIPYQTDAVVAVIPPSHPLHGCDSVMLPQLKNHRLCMLKETTLLYELCVRACQAADFVPNIFFESHRISNILEMCLRGGCVALLLDRQLQAPSTAKVLQEGNFKVVRIVPEISTSLSLAYLKSSGLSATASAFAELFREKASL